MSWVLRIFSSLILQIRTYGILKRVTKRNNSIFQTRVEFVLLRELKHRETKEAEEYCWAITQAAGRSCCGRSGSSVLEFGFRLDPLVPGADNSLAWSGREQARMHIRDARDFSNTETRAVINFFSARQGAEGNSRHSDRNICLFLSWSG